MPRATPLLALLALSPSTLGTEKSTAHERHSPLPKPGTQLRPGTALRGGAAAAAGTSLRAKQQALDERLQHACARPLLAALARACLLCAPRVAASARPAWEPLC